MINKVILIFLIILLISLVLYFDNNKEYFTDCIIYKSNTTLTDNTFYHKGELQLLWSFFTETENNELIRKTYNDKKKTGKLNETNMINLDKLNRKDHEDKKIVMDKLDPSNTDWSTCYFNDKSEKVFDDDKQTDDKVFFNRLGDISDICENITKLKTDTAVNQKEDIILLRIKCNSKDIDITGEIPETVKIDNIKIVKYDKNTRTIDMYEDGNDFIKYFFTLDPETLKFLPIKKQVMFYSFKNQFCNNKYELDKTFSCCFNINQLGFDSINFLNYNSVFSPDNINASDCDLDCEGDTITSFEDVKDEMKNNALAKAKKEYLKCKQRISSNYSNDKDILNSRRDDCVKQNTYALDNCKYKRCNYHKKKCDYEKDLNNINKYNKALDGDDFNSIDMENKHYIIDNSEKSYNICRKYIDYNSDFYKKIESIDSDETMIDNYLSNFDKENLYTDFNLLKYVSQDNCIYILIKNIPE
tara:strand:+ start:2385 stop:3800 length:1416 start_codon:yes stop_codon:yes gene_type:complete